MLHLKALKAFAPAPLPFPLLHVDTGHNFPEVIALPRPGHGGPAAGRRLGCRTTSTGARCRTYRNGTGLQTTPLLDAIEGGRPRRRLRRRPARRGEGPRQRAGVLAARRVRRLGPPPPAPRSSGTSTTAATRRGEHVRVFPLSNWTELDVWQYIAAEDIRAAADLLRARARGVRPPRHVALAPVRGAATRRRLVRKDRSATGQSATCPAPARSSRSARTPQEVIEEIAASKDHRTRRDRADDRLAEAAMEDRKREGYF